MKEIAFAFGRETDPKISFYLRQREEDILWSVSNKNGNCVEFFLSYDELNKLDDAIQRVKR